MTINGNILSWARSKLGERYDDGECWTYVEGATVQAGGKSSRELTPSFSDDADYVWGDIVSLGAVVPGNLLQFRNYQWVSNTIIKFIFSDGAYEILPTGASESRPHHSAIVDAVNASGTVIILEQNVPPGAPVTRKELRLTSLSRPMRVTQERRNHPQSGRSEIARVETTINEIVTGQVWAYQSKS